MEYYSAVKRNELLIHAMTYITLSERSQTLKVIYCMIPLRKRRTYKGRKH